MPTALALLVFLGHPALAVGARNAYVTNLLSDNVSQYDVGTACRSLLGTFSLTVVFGIRAETREQ